MHRKQARTQGQGVEGGTKTPIAKNIPKDPHCHIIWSVDSKKIHKMVDTRGQILGLKCTKFDFGWGSISDPDGELTALPQIPSWIQGAYF